MKLYYDMHIHSCLSPCADNDMTPADIAGIGALNNLSVMALTDHNSCENCPAFFEACKFYGILPIAGMELTTAEDIHIVCLFQTLEAALSFSEFVYSRLQPINNRPDIFGEQLIKDTNGNTLRTVEKLLIGSTDISIEACAEYVSNYGGICYPAHIDRESNGIISILGSIPPEPQFTCAELHNSNNSELYNSIHQSTRNLIFISNSDAHRISDINTNINFFDIPNNYIDSPILWIFEYLSGFGK